MSGRCPLVVLPAGDTTVTREARGQTLFLNWTPPGPNWDIPKEKPPRLAGGFFIAGAGFEPATFGL
jgi:hypothetical protein